jgi:tellurite resistance protein TerC
MQDTMLNHPGLITVFAISIFIMLILDLGVLNKRSHSVSNKEAAVWSAVWVSLAMIFSGVIYFVFEKADGSAFALEKFSQFQSAYWIEKALSVDNLFVFILVFGFFKIPKEYQHKILFWGILGALIFRAVFIFIGVEMIHHTYLPPFSLGDFHFVLDHKSEEYADFEKMQFFRPNIVLTIFGIFLIYAGIHSWTAKDDHEQPEDLNKSFGARFVKRFFKVSPKLDGNRFFTLKNGVRMATPLFTTLVIIEFTDLIFAVDSIPAIFAIAPNDPFILYTSNIFAILGLRSLYFLLANFMYMFSKLKYGLAIILSFIGVKMLIAPFFSLSSVVSLGIVVSVLFCSVMASIIFSGKKNKNSTNQN